MHQSWLTPDAAVAPAGAKGSGTFATQPIAAGTTVAGFGGNVVDRTEFDVLAVLSERPGMAFSRRQLIEQVWGQTWVGDEHLVDVHIGHLRRKLGDDAGAARFIRTVRGIGYRMGTGE